MYDTSRYHTYVHTHLNEASLYYQRIDSSCVKVIELIFIMKQNFMHVDHFNFQQKRRK